jgi:hypothetical protein
MYELWVSEVLARFLNETVGFRSVSQVSERLAPNTSFQRTLTRGGFGPLNSDR